MSRPGEKITRKSIQMQKKLKELDKKEMKSKSLLTNVLQMEDNIQGANTPHSAMIFLVTIDSSNYSYREFSTICKSI